MLDNSIIAVYFALVFWIGLRYARRERTSTDYFLAGRHTGWFAVGASLLATNIGSEHFIGLAGSGASSGLAVGCYEWSASICLLLLGWVFIPHYLASKVFTMPEFLERRFSPGARWYLTGISIFAYIFTKISVALFAGGILIREVFGWDFMTTSILLVIATGIYTIAGGLSAVIYTELFQAFLLVGGASVLTLLGLQEAGGFAGLRQSLPEEFFHLIKPIDHPVYPWLGTTVGTVILGIWYWCTDQVIVQRALSARSVADAQKGTIFAALLKILPVFVLVLPGLIAKSLWPSDVEGDNAYPLMILRLMPEGLKGIMVAALLAALMSSLAAVFNSCSTLLTLDVYRKLRPNASEGRLVLIGRLTTAVIVVVSVAWVPFIRYLNAEVYQYLQSVQAMVGAPITAVFLVGILWPRANARAALTTLLFGGAIGATRFLLDVMHNGMGYDLGALNGVVQFSFLNFSVILFAVCVGMMIAVSLAGEAPDVRRTLIIQWDHLKTGQGAMNRSAHIAMTAVVSVAIVGLWYYFR